MCHERERLIEYVYDECDADERARVKAHLETCAVCREEIAGLRETRQDLLAWEVPEHGSVWRPFAPARLAPWWREVPAWAMATAAGIMFLIGVSGGVAAQAVMARQAPAPRQAEAAPAAAQSTEVAVARAELSALETRLMAAVRASNEQMSRHVSAHSAETAGFVQAAVKDVVTNDQVTMLSLEFGRMWRKLNDLEKKNSQLNALVGQLTQQVTTLAGAGQPGR